MCRGLYIVGVRRANPHQRFGRVEHRGRGGVSAGRRFLLVKKRISPKKEYTSRAANSVALGRRRSLAPLGHSVGAAGRFEFPCNKHATDNLRHLCGGWYALPLGESVGRARFAWWTSAHLRGPTNRAHVSLWYRRRRRYADVSHSRRRTNDIGGQYLPHTSQMWPVAQFALQSGRDNRRKPGSKVPLPRSCEIAFVARREIGRAHV